MTTPRPPLDPIADAFLRLTKAAIAEARRLEIIWWTPGDGQMTSVKREDGYVIAYIGEHELWRAPVDTLDRIAANIARQRN